MPLNPNGEITRTSGTLYGALAVVTSIAEHDFEPLDGGSQSTFRAVIRRLDSNLVDEREEVLMMKGSFYQEVVGGRYRTRTCDLVRVKHAL